ncbi:MAG: leucyl/phenylalanyl-tRNA--protein transferase [Thermodesulfovibrionia bacterium]|nr:leucyl/phenylalanyl-tRNA--protein transferase [Thermodesulfovibrionia bacterium]
MPVFRLSDEIVFPPPHLSEENGLLAVGGDLSTSRLLRAYSMGIFPWYSDDSPILWWSPDPRLVLLPQELKISRSLRQTIKKGIFEVTMDRDFDAVINKCALVDRGSDRGTWITDEMREAYIRLHSAGYVHSVESWFEGELAGGLYGVALGSAFFGESMFTLKKDASKVAFVTLVQQLLRWEFTLIDCQVTTEHLLSFGAKKIPRSEFLKMLSSALKAPARKGTWHLSIKKHHKKPIEKNL